jgi:hypothetical protein
MAFSRRLGVIGILGASWLVAVGCGSDDDKKVNRGDTAGEGGEAAGGTPSSGGSNSNAGKGGMVIVVGGEGGSATAGTGGTAGSGGSAGTGGTTSDAGAAGIGGAAAGAAGGSAEGGAAGAPQALACDHECAIDDDCVILGAVDSSHKCNPVTKRCEDPNEVCSADSDCLAFASDWTGPCTDDTNCDEFYACVSYNGKPYCAPTSDADFGCIMGAPVTLPHVGAAGDIAVCGSEDPRCFDGKCAAGCGDSFKGGCNQGEGNVCNTDTGLCECDTTDDCATNLCENRHCLECSTDADCKKTSQYTGLDTCVNGKCGCSGSQVCLSGGFKNATPVCE